MLEGKVGRSSDHGEERLARPACASAAQRSTQRLPVGAGRDPARV